MRHFLLAILLICASPGFGAIAYVTSGNGNSGGADCTVSLSVNAGQFAVVTGLSTSAPGSNVLTVSDTNTDTFTQATSSPFRGTNQVIALWATLLGTTNASEVFTVHVTSTVNFQGCIVAIYSGLATSSFWDQAVAGANFTAVSTVTSGTTGTTSQADELVVGVLGGDNGAGVYTAAGGYTARNTASTSGLKMALEDKIVSSTGTQTATMTSDLGQTGSGIVTTLKAAITNIPGQFPRIQ